MSILTDDEAEHHLAGIATISVAGAELALERVPADAFHDPTARRVIEEAARLPDDCPGDDPDPIDRRIDAVAEACGMYPALLRDWVRHAPVMLDSTGSIAARVLVAAERRRVAEQAIATLQELGLVVRWRDRAA